ncbi:MAG: CoA transferase [Pseudomonadota bacterium]
MRDDLPYSGMKVFDATQGVAGPHCTMLLAQYGANVIKMEPPEGDWGRTLGKTYGDLCAHAVAFNRGKRSIAIDLKNAEGQAIAQKLAADADIVVESFRPGVMGRFGLGYDDVIKTNPNVIYLSVTGFGQSGPNSRLPVTDSVIQAFSGFMSINRDTDGIPQRIGMVAIDVITGLYAYQAIASAVLQRLRFGKGKYIDCSLMQSAAALQSAKIAEFHLEQGAPQTLYVPVGTMKTADGYINVTAMREQHYRDMMAVLGRPELADDERFNTREKRIERETELMPIVREAFTHKTTAEWAEALTESGVMNAPVSTYKEFLTDEHVAAVNGLSWIEHAGTGEMPLANIPGLDRMETNDGLSACPHVGEHTEAILSEFGYGERDIAKYIEGKAVATEQEAA